MSETLQELFTEKMLDYIEMQDGCVWCGSHEHPDRKCPKISLRHPMPGLASLFDQTDDER